MGEKFIKDKQREEFDRQWNEYVKYCMKKENENVGEEKDCGCQ